MDLSADEIKIVTNIIDYYISKHRDLEYDKIREIHDIYNKLEKERTQKNSCKMCRIKKSGLVDCCLTCRNIYSIWK